MAKTWNLAKKRMHEGKTRVLFFRHTDHYGSKKAWAMITTIYFQNSVLASCNELKKGSQLK